LSNRAGAIFRFYETHLSAIQANTQTSARFPRPDAYQRRSRDPCAPAPARPETLAAERRRATIRPAYAGLIFFDCAETASFTVPTCGIAVLGEIRENACIFHEF